MPYYISQSLYDILKYGIISVNKQKGITSAQTLDIIKKKIVEGCPASKSNTSLLKAGHGGTLDSAATGVLVVGLCQGCKFLKYLLKGNKKYEVTAVLGESTNTYNSLGKVTSTSSFSHVSRKHIEGQLQQFVGEILQIPPKFSALKRGGVRLSDLTMRGVDVQLSPRKVVCHEASCLEFNPPHFKLYVSSGPGFYIRSLINDLGKAVGSDAHVVDLNRTEQEPFELKDCLEIKNLTLKDIIDRVELNQNRYDLLKRAIARMKAKEQSDNCS